MVSENLIWENEKTLLINDVRFFLRWDAKELLEVESSEKSFVLGKSGPMIDRCMLLSDSFRASRRFLIWEYSKAGKALCCTIKFFSSTKLVAIDYSKKPVDALKHYIGVRKQVGA